MLISGAVFGRRPYGPGLISDTDTLIAATALEHGLIVVTLDSDFRRVPGLRYVLLETRTFLLIEQSES
jgi:predicted nucleic acid-binding protein